MVNNMKKQLLLCTVLIFSVNSITSMQKAAWEKAYWVFPVKIIKPASSVPVETKPVNPLNEIYRIIAEIFKNDFLFGVVRNDKLLIHLNERLTENEIKSRLEKSKLFNDGCLGKEQELLLNARSESQGPIKFIVLADGQIYFVPDKDSEEEDEKKKPLLTPPPAPISPVHTPPPAPAAISPVKSSSMLAGQIMRLKEKEQQEKCKKKSRSLISIQ